MTSEEFINWSAEKCHIENWKFAAVVVVNCKIIGLSSLYTAQNR